MNIIWIMMLSSMILVGASLVALLLIALYYSIKFKIFEGRD